MAYQIPIDINSLIEKKLKNVDNLIKRIGVSTNKVNKQGFLLSAKTQAAEAKAMASLRKGSMQAKESMARTTLSTDRLQRSLARVNITGKVTENQFKRLFNLPALSSNIGLAQLTGRLRTTLADKNITMAQAQMFRNVQTSMLSKAVDKKAVLKLGNQLGANLSTNFLDSFEKNIKGGKQMGRIEDFFKKRLVTVGSFFGIYAGAQFVLNSVRIKAQTDSAIRTMAAIMPNFGITGRPEEVMKFAKGDLMRFRREMTKIGIDPYTVQKPYAQFLASSQGTLDSARRNAKSFMVLGKVYGLTGEEMKGMFYALTQMQSKGVVSMEELRRQLGDRVPGALKLAADAMGMTTRELDKLVSSGDLASTILIEKMAVKIQKEYGGLVAFFKKGDLNTALQMLSFQFKNLQEAMGGTGASGLTAKFTIYGLTKALQSLTLVAPILTTMAFGAGLSILSKHSGALLHAFFGVRSFGALKKGIPMMSAFSGAIGSYVALLISLSTIAEKKQQGEKVGWKDWIMPSLFGALAVGQIGGGAKSALAFGASQRAKLKGMQTVGKAVGGIGKVGLLATGVAAIGKLFALITGFLFSVPALIALVTSGVGVASYMAYRHYKKAPADVEMNGPKGGTQKGSPIDINLNVRSNNNNQVESSIFNDNGLINVKYNYAGGLQ